MNKIKPFLVSAAVVLVVLAVVFRVDSVRKIVVGS
jgi:hypothetical protein